MRSYTQTVQQMQKTVKRSSAMAIIAKDYILLGLSGRQWMASLVICMMLMPVFLIPVGAASCYS